VNDPVATLKIINETFNLFPRMTLAERVGFLKDLKGVAEIKASTAEAKAETSCPVLNEPLILPCGVEKCRYWVDQPWAKNCVFHYLAEQQREALSVDQVAFLYRKSPARVDSIYKRCFKIVQRHFLKDHLRNKDVPRFSFLPGFCVHCQTKLTEAELNDKNLALTEGFGYCTADCKRKYPPNFFEIEKFFESEFLKVVNVGLEMFNYCALEEILGLQLNVLRQRLEKV
jgi:hypothetical protein